MNRSLCHDFRQGVAYMQQWMRHAPESAFYELEALRLRFRQVNIQKKLFHVYHILGMHVIDHLMHRAPLMSKEERQRLDARIATLREDQKRIEAEMEELHLQRATNEEERDVL